MSSVYPIPAAPQLTNEERKNPYAKFYEVPILDPEPEIMEVLRPGNPMDPADSIGFDELEKVFLPGGLPRNGYCLRPDGIGFIHMKLHLPNVTPEMRDFFYQKWLDADPLHYRIWLPGLHINHEKPFTESFGWGQGKVCFRHEIVPLNGTLDYRKLGLSAPAEELDPTFLSVAAACADFVPLDSETKGFANTNVGIYKSDGAGGLVGQVVSWFGMYVVDGKPMKVLKEDEAYDLENTRLYACHQAYEMTRLNQLLPEIYKLSNELGQHH